MTYFRLTQAIKIASMPSLLVCIAALSGCGGGGGTSTTTTTTVSPTPVTPTPVTTTPTACSLTAQTGGIASGALAQLNHYRNVTFAGASLSPLLFSADATLTTAAGNHSNYLSLLVSPSVNVDPRTHDEVSTNPCFTGTTVSARIAAAGNTDSMVGEDFSETSFATSVVSNDATLAANAGASIVDGLFNAVYHRMSLLSNFTNAGIAWQKSTNPNLPPTILTIDLSQHQVNTYGNFITYPYNGQTGVFIDWLVDENPCPLGCSNTGALAGFPITIQTDGRALVISSFTVTSSGGSVSGSVLTATAGTYSADANLANEHDRAAFVPLAPLSPNTTYTATVVGTSGGVAFTQAWTFTTLPITAVHLTSSASTVAVGGTFDVTFSGGSQNYNSTSPLSWSSVNGSGSSPVSLSYVQLASNSYRFTYNGNCTLSSGCPVTFTGTDSQGNTGTTLVTVSP